MDIEKMVDAAIKDTLSQEELDAIIEYFANC